MNSKGIIKRKQITSLKHRSGVIDLLKIAERLGKQTRKLDNLINWREKTFSLSRRSDLKRNPVSLLKAAQVQRDAGIMNSDRALSCIFLMAERLAVDFAQNDLKLKKIATRIDAVKKREGLEEDEFWTASDPVSPKEWRILNDQYDHRIDEIIAAFLNLYGENETADLFLHNKEEFDRRFEAGRRLTFKKILGQPV